MSVEKAPVDPQALSQEVRDIWEQNALWRDRRIGDGNEFQNMLIEPATERLLGLQPGELVLDVAYNEIATNLLFFQRDGPTREIWYYELPLPEGRRQYTKTKPLRDAEFDECRALWDERPETEHSWLVPVAQVIKNDYNLDIQKALMPQEHIAYWGLTGTLGACTLRMKDQA